MDVFEKYGLFDARVPRFTSYPPTNRFHPETGKICQQDWLAATPPDRPISLYIHIPFCRRLCWFCACRTQGTKTLSPVADYVSVLISEIGKVAQCLPKGISIQRLHLGGGTPTILSSDLLDRLLDTVFETFPVAQPFEFSVEVDPTEAAPELLQRLAHWNMNRASLGVQDFAPAVQKAIGRSQSFEETLYVTNMLRDLGINSLNLDLLYGLPFQNKASLLDTLGQVQEIQPDRIALYGYAHVPHMSKRQVMIPERALPKARERFELARTAEANLVSQGYVPLGIDHFSKPGDGLLEAACKGSLRRNFQGYTDDPCETLIGVGASAISRFPQGFSQNAVATNAYRSRIAADQLAGQKGHQLLPFERIVASMIEALMCYGKIEVSALSGSDAAIQSDILEKCQSLKQHFPEALELQNDALHIKSEYAALTRIVAAALDEAQLPKNIHSLAI